MTGVVIILAIVGLGIGVLIWRRRRSWEAYVTSEPADAVSRTDLALKAFAHGNSCLAAGEFADAIAAFHQTLEIDPKHPHVAGRLAEVERQQRAMPARAAV